MGVGDGGGLCRTAPSSYPASLGWGVAIEQPLIKELPVCFFNFIFLEIKINVSPVALTIVQI